MLKTVWALDKPLVHTSCFCFSEETKKRPSAEVVLLTEMSEGEATVGTGALWK